MPIFYQGFEVHFSLHFGTNGVLCCCAAVWSYDDCMRVRYWSIGSVPGRKKKSLKNETLFLWCISFLWCTDVQNHCYFSIPFIILAADGLHLITMTLVLYILYIHSISIYVVTIYCSGTMNAPLVGSPSAVTWHIGSMENCLMCDMCSLWGCYSFLNNHSPWKKSSHTLKLPLGM